MEEFLIEILEIIKSNLTNKEKKEKLLKYHDYDIAYAFTMLENEEKINLVKILGKEKASDVISYLEDSDEFLELLKYEDAADFIELMDADDAVDILEDLNKEDRDKIIELLDEEAKEDVKLILSFDKEQIGSLMTTNFIAVTKGDGVKGAMKKLIKQAKDNDNVSTLIVLNDQEEFFGCLDLKHLIIARDGENLTEKVKTNYPHLYATDLIGDVKHDLVSYAEDIIPVLDENDHVIGVITSNDIVELVETEASEDYSKLAGLTSVEEDDEPLFGSIKKRIPWLALLLVLGLFVSTVTSIFSNVISDVTIAVAFQSVVLGMAGNGGTQTLAVTLTKISQDDEIDKKKVLVMLIKEFSIGIVNGLLLGIFSFIVVFLFLIIRNQPVVNDSVFNYYDCILVASSVGLSLFFALILSSLLGLLLPILFKKIKIDPAIASGPMITTLNDLFSSCIYYVFIGVLFNLLF